MITIEKIHHKGEYRIAVHFPREKNLIDKLRTIPGTLWSQTKTTWHIPYSMDAYKKLLELFPELRLAQKETTRKSSRVYYRAKQIIYEEKQKPAIYKKEDKKNHYKVLSETQGYFMPCIFRWIKG